MNGIKLLDGNQLLNEFIESHCIYIDVDYHSIKHLIENIEETDKNPETIGTTTIKIDLMEPVGNGAGGEVLLVKNADGKYNNDFVVKWSEKYSLILEFLNQMKVISVLGDRNCVQFYKLVNYYKDNKFSQSFVIMEKMFENLLKLDENVYRRHFPDIKNAILYQLLKLNANEIYHKDLKKDNIMVKYGSNGDTKNLSKVAIIDYGLVCFSSCKIEGQIPKNTEKYKTFFGHYDTEFYIECRIDSLQRSPLRKLGVDIQKYQDKKVKENSNPINFTTEGMKVLNILYLISDFMNHVDFQKEIQVILQPNFDSLISCAQNDKNICTYLYHVFIKKIFQLSKIGFYEKNQHMLIKEFQFFIPSALGFKINKTTIVFKLINIDNTTTALLSMNINESNDDSPTPNSLSMLNISSKESKMSKSIPSYSPPKPPDNSPSSIVHPPSTGSTKGGKQNTFHDFARFIVLYNKIIDN